MKSGMRGLPLIALCFFAGGVAIADEVEDMACNVTFSEGNMPYSKVVALRDANPDTLDELSAMVKDNAKTHCWPNAVWMIGVLGWSDTQADTLIAFIERGEREITRDELLAKSDAVFALGLLANVDSKRALKYLRTLVERRNEKKVSFTWSPPQPEAEGTNRFFALRAANALGISGKDEAVKFLRAFTEDSDIRFRQTVIEAITHNRNIDRLGIMSEYH